MADSSFDIDHAAQLARLELSEDEKIELRRQLQDILSYVDRLKEVDVEGVEPTAHPASRDNVLRPDAVRPGLSRDDALANAPAQANGLFLVPKIVE